MTNDIDNLLYRHLLGETSEDENLRIREWLETSEENRRFFFEIAAIHSVHRVLSAKDLGQRREQMISRLNARIDADEAMRRQVRRGRLVRLRGIAAAAAAVVIAAGVWFYAGRYSADEQFRTFINTSDEIASLRLDDGTEVWMQAGTRLRYAVGAECDERTVHLDGEAFFDVTHDAQHPFVVRTENLDVRVLGTAFNVKAFDAEHRTEVVLERGSVRLQTPEGTNLIRLHPNQKAIYDQSCDEIEVEEIYASHFVTQRYDLVAMTNATIREIIASVEKHYGVRIRIPDPDDPKQYDINYLRSSTLEEVIAIIEYMTGQRCEAIFR